jgi:hypothetical protein
LPQFCLRGTQRAEAIPFEKTGLSEGSDIESTSDIVRIKIALDAVKPAVMRRIEVPVSVKLDTLHEIIQAIMPWGNYHLYQFHVRERRWGIPMPDVDIYPIC